MKAIFPNPKKIESSIDLSKVKITYQILENILKKIQTNKYIYHIKWQNLPQDFASIKLVNQILKTLKENFNNYTYYPSDFIHGLLSVHVYKDSQIGDQVKFNDDEPGFKFNEFLKDWHVADHLSHVEYNYYSVLYTTTI